MPPVEATVEGPDVSAGHVVDGPAEDVDGGSQGDVGSADGGAGDGWERGESSVILMFGDEREEEGRAERGAERDVENGLGGVEERSCGEEERGREDGPDWFRHQG